MSTRYGEAAIDGLRQVRLLREVLECLEREAVDRARQAGLPACEIAEHIGQSDERVAKLLEESD